MNYPNNVNLKCFFLKKGKANYLHFSKYILINKYRVNKYRLKPSI